MQPDPVYTVVPVTGRLDTATTTAFEKQCVKLISEGISHIVLDLTGLQYISSSGLRSILVVAKKLQANDGALALCNPGGIVQEVISISGFDNIFPVYDNLEALATHSAGE